MKRCLNCDACFDAKAWTCPVCGFGPVESGRLFLFSPVVDGDSTAFSDATFASLAKRESRHFWFVERNKLVVWAIRKFFPRLNSFLEVGCGTGFVLAAVEKALPEIALAGSELATGGLSWTNNRVKSAQLFQLDARRLPFRNEFDVIGAFDVLEHIREDTAVLREMHAALVPGGGIVLTVPQHGFLWSVRDEYAGHFRRYERKEIVAKVQDAGFSIESVTSFVSLLMPAMWISRVTAPKRVADLNPESELNISTVLNWVFGRILSIERELIKCGVRLPFGGSLMLVARKQ